MSETTGPAAPAAPAPDAAPAPAPRRGRAARAPSAAPAPAAPTGQLGLSSRPANAQPRISVSDAARMLGQQRKAAAAGDRPASGEAPAAPAAPERKPSPNDVAAAKQANDNRAAGNDNATSKPAAPPAAKTASALERALGVNPEAAPAQAEPNDGAIMEIDNQRLRTLDEVREYVQRKNADWTKKTQELSEGRRQVQAQQEALATVLPYIQPELARLAEIVQNAPQKPDPALLDVDPNRYHRERAYYEQAIEQQQRLGGLTTLQQQAQGRAMEQAVQAANVELAKEIEGWADPQERDELQKEIVAWATTKGGFSRDELRGLTSPHHLKAMMKAAMYDKMIAGAKSQAPPQRFAAPPRGTAPPAPPTERIEKATQAFNEKPNWRTGAALLSARRNNH